MEAHEQRPKVVAGTIRDVNRQRIVAALRGLGAASRGSLEQVTGLSRGTVASIVGELLDEEMLLPCGEAEHPAHAKGRPPELFRLASRAALAVAVDIGRRHVRVAVGKAQGSIVAERHAAISQDIVPKQALQVAASLVTGVLTDAKVASRYVDAAVVGLPTPVTADGKPVKSAFVGLDIAAETGLARLTPRIRVMNDADLGALGEATFGAARGLSDFIFFKMSSGVGAGIMLGGRLHRGSGGFAGDIAHVRVREEGDWCACGSRGCLETLVSDESVSASVRKSHPGLGPAEIHRFLASADPEAEALLYTAGWKAGRVLSGVINVLNPSAIVVGGSLGTAGRALLSGLTDSIHRHAQPSALIGLRVQRAQHGERAEVLGALAVALGLAEDGVPQAVNVPAVI
jgi:predicted NBD/HSP70 family sugar kinase